MGTPVVEDYADNMPFAFTGMLKKFDVILEPESLTPDERKRLLEEAARASISVHYRRIAARGQSLGLWYCCKAICASERAAK
jgi:hypothetical protein